MYKQRNNINDSKSCAVSHSVTQNKSIGTQSLEYVDNRVSNSKNVNATSATESTTDDVAQRMEVLQLATRRSRPVRFNGSGFQLEQLILRWGAPAGTQVVATQTDFVGGMYTVRFTNRNGPAISIDTADAWVQAGIAHAGDLSDSSEEDVSE